MHLGREHVALVVGRHVLARLDPDAGGAAGGLAQSLEHVPQGDAEGDRRDELVLDQGANVSD